MDLIKNHLLVCPSCKNSITTENEYCFCSLCNKKYFFIEGSIFSFIEKTANLNSDFETHWEKNDSLEIPATKIHTAENFLKPLSDFLKSKAGQNKLILDAGCGDAVHAEVDHLKNQNNNFVGIDISLNVLLRNKEKCFKNWNFVHGDITKLPFKDNVFDAVFSYGVVCYTVDPEKTISELLRVLKPKGLLGIWIYPKKKCLSAFLFASARKSYQSVGQIGRKLIADLIVPILFFLPTKSKVNLFNASWRQCREIVLVNIAPEKLYFPDSEEVKKWFTNNNCTIIQEDIQNPITIWAKKNK